MRYLEKRYQSRFATTGRLELLVLAKFARETDYVLLDGINWLFSKSARLALCIVFPLVYSAGVLLAFHRLNLFWNHKNLMISGTVLAFLVVDGLYHAAQPERIAKRVFVAQLILVGLVCSIIEGCYVLNWNSPILPLFTGIIGYLVCRKAAYSGAAAEPGSEQPRVIQGHKVTQATEAEVRGSVAFYVERLKSSKHKAKVGESDGEL